MRYDDQRHRVQIGDLVSHRRTTLSGQVTEIGLVVSWSGDGFVANVIFENRTRQLHARKLKVINETR